MSDLSATQCGCGCDNNGSFLSGNGGCSSCIWIILLLLFCGGGCGNNGSFLSGNNGSCCDIIIILLLLSCCNGTSNANDCGCGC